MSIILLSIIILYYNRMSKLVIIGSIVSVVIIIIVIIILVLNRNTNQSIILQLKDNEKELKNQLSQVENRLKELSKPENVKEVKQEKIELKQFEQNKEIQDLQNQIKQAKDNLLTLKSQINAVNNLPKQETAYIDNFVYPAYTQSVLPFGGMYTKVPNIPYFNPNWYRVGLLISHPKPDKNGKTENATVLTLFRRDVIPDRDFYQYKVRDEFAPGRMEIFLPTNVTLLNNDKKIHVLGFENKNPFTVKLDDQYRFTMMY